MQLDVYLQETANNAAKQKIILEAAKQQLHFNKQLTPLEFSGVLHAIQVAIENAIGKAKHLQRYHGKPVSVNAYDALQSLADTGVIASTDLDAWRRIIGMRNRIVHDYMNLDTRIVMALLETDGMDFVFDFLMADVR